MRPDLIARYADERLPRYTSYPTAPHFSPAVGPEAYAGWLGALAAATMASLYLHIPYCRRMCWYCGCNTSVTARRGPVSAYVAALRREIAMVAAHLGRPLPVVHIHFGGGTPTIVAPGEFRTLIDHLRAGFDVRPGAEIAVEIDPRTLDLEMARTLGETGVTRASLGVQSLDPAVQAAINRRQSLDETALAVDRLRAAGIPGINIDLIYGLPHQTVASSVETVEACLSLRPDRFSVFGYAHVPAFKKHQRKIDAGALPAGAARNDQAEAVAARLEAADYLRIGLDHFVLPSDSMALAAAGGVLHRNFQGYTTDPAGTLIGLGASAIGRLPAGYVQNATVTRDYLAAIADGRFATVKGFPLGNEDRLRAELIERLMCDFRVDAASVCRARGEDIEAISDALPELDRLAGEGVIRREGWLIEVEPEARSLVRAVAAAFDAYRAQSQRTHSAAL